MGLFDFLGGKKTARTASAPAPVAPTALPEQEPNEAVAEAPSLLPAGFASAAPDLHLPPEAPPLEPIDPTEIEPTLRDACAHLERKDLPGAMLLYENLLARGGDAAEAVTTISADLGANGFTDALIELIAPIYDPVRHGAIAGINLLQAYLTVQNTDAAQQLLDVLRSLNQSDLETRLHGLASALEQQKRARSGSGRGGEINMISLSKPIWYYGLESAPTLLPTQNPASKRIAFVPLAVPRAAADRGKEADVDPALLEWSRAIPLAAADAFFFTANYAPLALVTLRQKLEYWPHSVEWLPEQVKSLSTKEGGECDYAVTGFVQADGDQVNIGLRVWETAKARARKLFTETCPREELGQRVAALLKQLLYYMETQPLPATASPIAVRSETLSTAQMTGYAQSLDFFLTEKQL
ncbi:MAG TPA: hypothetical protein VKC60_00925, partial [Opitutaceae bacterium]|nr:hypothetical protein [Opitutaceae bacterium]